MQRQETLVRGRAQRVASNGATCFFFLMTACQLHPSCGLKAIVSEFIVEPLTTTEPLKAFDAKKEIEDICVCDVTPSNITSLQNLVSLKDLGIRGEARRRRLGCCEQSN